LQVTAADHGCHIACDLRRAGRKAQPDDTSHAEEILELSGVFCAEGWPQAVQLVEVLAAEDFGIALDHLHYRLAFGEQLHQLLERLGGLLCVIAARIVREEVLQHLGIRQPYILYVGNLKPHKNVPVLLRAFALLRSRISIPHGLVVLGDDRKGSLALSRECEKLKISDATVLIPRVPARVLPNLYAAADLLVMPSRVEGFGLPVLESMASGTPVICSRAASLPEVGADAVLYFDPQDADELASLMQSVLESPDLHADLRMRGLARARELTWKQSVQRHLEVYGQVLEKG